MGRSSTTFAIFTLFLRNDNHQFVFDKIHSENTVKSIKTVTYRVYIFQRRQSSTQNWPQSAGTAPNGYSGSLACNGKSGNRLFFR